MCTKSKKAKHYTEEEREAVIKKIETLTGRPYHEFYLFEDEWNRMYGSDAIALRRDEGTRKIKRESRLKPASLNPDFYDDIDEPEHSDDGPKSDDVLTSLDASSADLITDIFHHDDEELQGRAVTIVLVGLRFYIRKILKRYGLWYDPNNKNDKKKEDGLNAAAVAIMKDLPSYDSSQGTFTTYFDGRIKKAIGIEKHGGKITSRHLEDLKNLVAKCREYAAVTLGNYEPTPETIHEIATKIFKRKSVKLQSIINAMDADYQVTSSDEDENFANRIASDHWNPEAEYLKKEKAEDIIRQINMLPPLERCVMESYYYLQEVRNKGNPSDTQLTDVVQRTYPGLSPTEIKKAKKAAINKMSVWQHRDTSTHVRRHQKPTEPKTMAYFMNAADEISEAMEGIDFDEFFD